mmetsp:Transcript_82676/g.121146  ORF Transcript_82676/g.121146 Transcript_82676/m.121146 type:complete len:133 (-) Transcript_82676:457-855(-)
MSTMARNRCATAGVSAGRWLMQRQVHRESIRRLSQGALPNAKSLYRDLLRTVREFPAEPMLDLNASGSEQSFAVIASLNIRVEFKANADTEPVMAGKLIAAGQKELKALHAMLNNEHIKRFPGPPMVDKLYQ